jgi:uncharacterized protein
MHKREIRLLGIDDAAFKKSDRHALVIGVLFRGGIFMDGCLSTEVRVDGTDSTEKIASMVNSCKWRDQLKAILLDGIAVAGFNVVDINRLNAMTGIPVIVVIRHRPDIPRIKRVMEELGMKERIGLIDAAGPIQPSGKVWVQVAGIKHSKAEDILKLSSTRSYLPEPIRIAHLIGQGIAFGESKGRA